MKNNTEQLFQEFSQKNLRALSRLISLAENQDKSLHKWLAKTYANTGKAKIIGVTGPPGSGKSSLVSHFIKSIRERSQSVGVIAIDPMSPFTGGALLGDRIRLTDHFNDPEVFIRSLSTRGKLGGLSLATRQVVHLMDGYGMDYILVETVGVGQSEVDIREIADATLVLLVPESGDGIQTLKAGVLEIGDLFIVNKSEREGSDHLVTELKNMVQRANKAHQEVFKTSIKDRTSFEKLFASVDSFLTHQKDLIKERRKNSVQSTARDLLQTIVLTQAEEWIKNHLGDTQNPYEFIESFLKKQPPDKLFNQ